MFFISFQLESVQPAFNRHLSLCSGQYQLKINTQRVACEVLPVFSVLALSLSAASCAVTSGLQTYDIPSEGVYKTDLGTTVNVVKISQETLPAIQPAQIDYQRDYASLFKTNNLFTV